MTKNTKKSGRTHAILAFWKGHVRHGHTGILQSWMLPSHETVDYQDDDDDGGGMGYYLAYGRQEPMKCEDIDMPAGCTAKPLYLTTETVSVFLNGGKCLKRSVPWPSWSTCCQSNKPYCKERDHMYLRIQSNEQ
ncbi:hypothetical protein PSPO01_01755 [Paraphaeosphaeria sporulosa]